VARKLATESQRQEVRRRLRSAAASVYRVHGIAGVTARAVAIAAGVSVGTIYAHFGDLKSLMQSLWIEPLEKFNDRFREVAASHEDPVARLRGLMELYVAIAHEFPELYRNAFMFVRAEPLPGPDDDLQVAAVFGDLLRATLRDGQAAGLIREGSVDRQMELVWAGLHGSIALPINFDRLRFSQTPLLASDMIELLLAQLRA